MKKKFMNLVCATAITAATLSGVTACGANGNDVSNDGNSANQEQNDGNLAGTLSLAGSTSMEKLCESLMEGFMEANPDVTVTTEYTGSGAGLESLVAGSVDIGNASRKVKDEEAEKGLVENVVALDGIAVITDKENKTTDLTKEELTQIYEGEIKNWSELGGADETIVVIGRESGSGTRDAFEELLDVADMCQYAQELDSTGAVLAKVAATPGAIGYVSLDAVDDTVADIALDGVEATEENILSGDYILQRPFVMATKGELSEQNNLVKAWFDYINSDEGKDIVKGAGLIIPQ